jgi:hypothetical protein
MSWQPPCLLGANGFVNLGGQGHPVEIIIGLPVAAILRISGKSVTSKDATL